jgi:hypothetical protein
MSRFENIVTGVVVSVDDSKDSRFTDGWKRPGPDRQEATEHGEKRGPGRPKKNN